MKWAVHDLLQMRNEGSPMNSLKCARWKRSQVHNGKDNRGESGGDVKQPQKWHEEKWDNVKKQGPSIEEEPDKNRPLIFIFIEQEP